MSTQLKARQIETVDGWQSSPYTWTYASASTFTISGVDLTSVFTKGTRLKFTQTTVKYAVVVSSSFSTNTTVTIAVNTDYTIANATITSPFYSYQANPQGYPTWFNWTPTYPLGFSSSPPNAIKYKIEGSSITVDTSGMGAGTSNATTFQITSPVTIVGSSTGFGGVYDNSGWQTACGFLVADASSSTTVISVYKNTYSSNNWTASATKAIYGQITYKF